MKFIIGLAAKAPRRRPQLTSNVRPQKMPSDSTQAQQEANTELQRAPSAVKATALKLYELLLAEHRQATILVWPKQRIISFGHGPKKMSEHYAYIGIQAQHVNLGFYMGASLQDPSRLLEGTGKKLRHIKLRSTSEVQSPALLALLRCAIQEGRVRATVSNRADG